ncbi:MAG: hypothetical protein AAGC55_29955 [Myxococcota bacterium]
MVSSRVMLLIDECIDKLGKVVRTHVEVVESIEENIGGTGRVKVILDHRGQGTVPTEAIAVVMKRYGRPLDDLAEQQGHFGPTLELGAGQTLRSFRFRAAVDASGRHYLVWSAPEQEPLAALSRGVAAALRHLALRATRQTAVP